jgi:hypothetical protein
VALALLGGSVITGQTPNSADFQEFGYLSVEHSRAPWPSPETVTRDLHSTDQTVRLNALKLIGIPERLQHKAIFSTNSSPTTVIGEEVITPDQIDIRFTRLGEDQSLHAVLSVEISGDMMFAAVASPRGKQWERVAILSCWCKYETRPMREFVEIETAAINPEGPVQELVARGSGGGTGIYSQSETHFRIRGNRLVSVLSVPSRTISCPMAPVQPCTVNFKWFSYGGPTDTALVEADDVFDGTAAPNIVFRVRELQLRDATKLKCTPFAWDPQAFVYKPAGPNAPCRSTR